MSSPWFRYIGPRKDPYCNLLLSVMPVDEAQKKMMKFDWMEAEIWEFYSKGTSGRTQRWSSYHYGKTCSLKPPNIRHFWFSASPVTAAFSTNHFGQWSLVAPKHQPLVTVKWSPNSTLQICNLAKFCTIWRNFEKFLWITWQIFDIDNGYYL